MYKPAIALLLVAGAFASAPAWTQATFVTVETSVEASTEYVSLPSSPTGAWTFSACADCTSHLVRFDAGSQYLIGNVPVTFDQLRKYAAKGPQLLDVFFEPKTRRVTRIVLHAENPAGLIPPPAKQPRRIGS